MPRRSNAFQSVVYLVKKHMGDATIEVHESAELLDSATGRKREVDVIETKVDGHGVLVGFECAARGRKPDAEWVEQMYGKHSTLPTDHLVLVSESGFTAQARVKAKALGIETIVPDQDTDRSIDELTHRLTRLRFTKLELLNIEDVYVTLGATDTEDREENVHLLPSSREMRVFMASRELIGTIGDVVNSFMAVATRDKSVFEDVLFGAADDARFFELSIDPPEILIGDPPALQRIYFEKIEPTPHLRAIEKVRIEGKARIERFNFPLRRGSLQEIPYSWGESVMEGRPAVVVITAQDDQLKITPKTY
jgi:hypothetical protein